MGTSDILTNIDKKIIFSEGKKRLETRWVELWNNNPHRLKLLNEAIMTNMEIALAFNISINWEQLVVSVMPPQDNYFTYRWSTGQTNQRAYILTKTPKFPNRTSHQLVSTRNHKRIHASTHKLTSPPTHQLKSSKAHQREILKSYFLFYNTHLFSTSF